MRTSLGLLTCLIVTCSLRAEINIGYTAESVSHESALIALATPLEAEDIKGPGQVWFTKARFKLTEVIKGPVSSGDIVTVYDYSYKQPDLVGLKRASKAEKPKSLLLFARVARNTFAEIDDKYILTLPNGGKTCYVEGAAVDGLYTPEGGLLAKFDDLVKRTRAQVEEERRFLKTYPGGTVETKRAELSWESDAHKKLYSGSACYVYVPDYRKPPENPKKGD